MGEVREYLDAGYSPDMTTTKNSNGMLHLAADSMYVGKLPSLALVQTLLERKANPDLENGKRYRALHIACGLPGTSALSREGNEQVAMLLIKAGSDTTAPTPDGWSPIQLASNHGRHEIMKALLQRKADPAAPNPAQDTPLHLLLQCAGAKKMSDSHMNKSVVLLLGAGADPNVADAKGKLPIYFALNDFFHQASNTLLAFGAGVIQDASMLLDSHAAVAKALKKDEEHLLLIEDCDLEASFASVPSLGPTQEAAPTQAAIPEAATSVGVESPMERVLADEAKAMVESPIKGRSDTAEEHSRVIREIEKWIAQRHMGNRAQLLHYVKVNKLNFGQLLSCMRVSDGFRLILSAIALGVEEIGFDDALQKAKASAAAKALSPASPDPPAPERSRKGKKQMSSLAKSVKAAKGKHDAIPTWLTDNMVYFQQYFGQLLSAENQKAQKDMVKDKQDREDEEAEVGEEAPARRRKSRVDNGTRKRRVTSVPAPTEPQEDVTEEISPYKMLREVCQTRMALQDETIAMVHLKDRLHHVFKDLVSEELQLVSCRQDDPGLVPVPTKGTSMDETGFGFALVMLGMALTPSFTTTVTSLLKKKMSTSGYTIMKAPCKSFPRMFNKLKTDHYNAKTPRYAQNVDIVRMGVVCETPKDLGNAMKVISKGMDVIRAKNSFVLKDPDEKRGGYRALLLNLKHSDKANQTYADLVASSSEMWEDYRENLKSRHKNQVTKALKWMSSRAMAKKKVVMACEIQLIYQPYFFYRKNVHFLYKVLRTESLEEFVRDFSPKTDEDAKKNAESSSRRAQWANSRMTRHSVRLLGATDKKADDKKRKEKDTLPLVKHGASDIGAAAVPQKEEFHLPAISIASAAPGIGSTSDAW